MFNLRYGKVNMESFVIIHFLFFLCEKQISRLVRAVLARITIESFVREINCVSLTLGKQFLLPEYSGFQPKFRKSNE